MYMIPQPRLALVLNPSIIHMLLPMPFTRSSSSVRHTSCSISLAIGLVTHCLLIRRLSPSYQWIGRLLRSDDRRSLHSWLTLHAHVACGTVEGGDMRNCKALASFSHCHVLSCRAEGLQGSPSPLAAASPNLPRSCFLPNCRPTPEKLGPAGPFTCSPTATYSLKPHTNQLLSLPIGDAATFQLRLRRLQSDRLDQLLRVSRYGCTTNLEILIRRTYSPSRHRGGTAVSLASCAGI